MEVLHIMFITEFLDFMSKLGEYMSGDLFANSIAFVELIIAIFTISFGGVKVSQFFAEYKSKKLNAVFGYYANLRMFMKRLKRLTTNSNNEPLGNIYLLSAETEISTKGKGYEDIAKKLSNLANEFLQYLSTKPEQIPVADCKEDADDWNNLIENLSDFLSDFFLYNTGVYLPQLNSENAVRKYHTNLIELINEINKLIEDSSEDCWEEIEE